MSGDDERKPNRLFLDQFERMTDTNWDQARQYEAMAEDYNLTANQAANWAARGFTADGAREWMDAGFGPDEAFPAAHRMHVGESPDVGYVGHLVMRTEEAVHRADEVVERQAALHSDIESAHAAGLPVEQWRQERADEAAEDEAESGWPTWSGDAATWPAERDQLSNDYDPDAADYEPPADSPDVFGAQRATEVQPSPTAGDIEDQWAEDAPERERDRYLDQAEQDEYWEPGGGGHETERLRGSMTEPFEPQTVEDRIDAAIEAHEQDVAGYESGAPDSYDGGRLSENVESGRGGHAPECACGVCVPDEEEYEGPADEVREDNLEREGSVAAEDQYAHMERDEPYQDSHGKVCTAPCCDPTAGGWSEPDDERDYAEEESNRAEMERDEFGPDVEPDPTANGSDGDEDQGDDEDPFGNGGGGGPKPPKPGPAPADPWAATKVPGDDEWNRAVDQAKDEYGSMGWTEKDDQLVQDADAAEAAADEHEARTEPWGITKEQEAGWQADLDQEEADEAAFRDPLSVDVDMDAPEEYDGEVPPALEQIEDTIIDWNGVREEMEQLPVITGNPALDSEEFLGDDEWGPSEVAEARIEALSLGMTVDEWLVSEERMADLDELSQAAEAAADEVALPPLDPTITHEQAYYPDELELSDTLARDAVDQACEAVFGPDRAHWGIWEQDNPLAMDREIEEVAETVWGQQAEAEGVSVRDLVVMNQEAHRLRQEEQAEVAEQRQHAMASAGRAAAWDEKNEQYRQEQQEEPAPAEGVAEQAEHDPHGLRWMSPGDRAVWEHEHYGPDPDEDFDRSEELSRAACGSDEAEDLYGDHPLSPEAEAIARGVEEREREMNDLEDAAEAEQAHYWENGGEYIDGSHPLDDVRDDAVDEAVEAVRQVSEDDEPAVDPPADEAVVDVGVRLDDEEPF